LVRTRAGLLLAAALCAVTAGCGNEAAVGRETLAARLADGFAAQADLVRATDRLGRLCMEQQGFRVHPTARERPQGTPLAHENPDIEIAMGARLINNEDRVREIGYGMSPQEMLGFVPGRENAAADPFSRLPRAEQNRYWIAYQGYSPDDLPARNEDAGDVEGSVDLPGHEQFTLPDGSKVSYPRTGCVADVERRLFDGKVREFHELTHYARTGIGKAAIGEVRADAEVREAGRRWSECMTRQGYPGLGEPMDAENKASTSYGPTVFGPESPGYDRLKKAEIALAETDYGCNREAGLDEVRVRVFWRNVARFYTDRETEVAAWSDLVASAKLRGQEMLGG
jgi:hypothetical protein